MKTLWIVVIFFVAVRLAWQFFGKSRPAQRKNTGPLKPLKPWQKKIFTVWVFARLNARRFFRDRLAIFFGILFPLIFLVVFGLISKGNNVSFNIALVNDSKSQVAQQFVSEAEKTKIFKINKSITSLSAAKDKLSKSQLDGVVILPSDFGQVKNGRYPSGQAYVYYTQNNDQAGQALTSILQGEFKALNARFVTIKEPFSVTARKLNEMSLTAFDYTFAGLLGFSVLGLGIFGPMNVFPELKKQGILRRFHTTPLRVWQYFTSTMISQAAIGLVSLAIMFAVAISVFHLKVIGNWLEIAIFLVYSIVIILGIGLSIGGWARNERQAAPLGNIVVFPMMFLSGVFFPRFLMPDWLQGITAYIPLSPVIDGVRLLVTEGKHLTDLGSQLGVMTIWLIIIYIIAFRVFRWE